MVALTWLVLCTSGIAAPAQEKFSVNEYRVLGNSVLDAKLVESAVYPFLGPDKSLKDVEAARTSLENAYHVHGYGTVFVDIPEQSVSTDGIVRLRVTEAHLNKVEVIGAKYFSERDVRSELEVAQRGAVPNLPALQQQIQSTNTVTRDREVIPVLKAGPQPGTVDLSLKVQDTLPLHGMVEVNNQYTPDTSPLRSLLVLSYDNLFNRFDSISLQYQTAPLDRSAVDVVAAAYIARLNNGDRLSFTFVNSSSSVPAIGTLGVLGKGQIYSLRYVKPLILSADSTAQWSFGADYKDFSQDVLVGNASMLSTPITYASLSGAFSYAVRWPSRQWSWSTSVDLGIPAVGDGAREFADKCLGCRPNFAVFRADSQLIQRLPAGFSGVLAVGAQYSADPVISNEQFLIGGAHSVRGYYEAEELGDIGVHGTLELHAPNTLPKTWRVSALPFLFYDAGRANFQNPLPGQPTAVFLQSFGAGVEFNAFGFWYGSVTWSNPLADATRTHRGDSRWEFVMRSSW